MTGLALYHSPWGLLPFQADGVARSYLEKRNIAVWSCGIGKTHLGMADAALCFEDDEVDIVIVVCERNKVGEWMDDIATFTDLTAVRYHTTRDKRAAIRDALPQVLVSTYETIRLDAAEFDRAHPRRQPTFGPLAEKLAGQRVFFIYDEVTKLKGRTSWLHRGHRALIEYIEATGGDVRILGLTATPTERGIDDYYNILRIIDPKRVGLVSEFDKLYTTGKDDYGNYISFKNISPADCEEGVVSFAELVAPIVMRKRKSDPDVRDQFPEQVEEFRHVLLDDKHADFYREVQKLQVSEAEEVTLFGLLRQVAGHPLSLLTSKGKLAQEIVAGVGARGLAKINCAKVDQLLLDLDDIIGNEGAQCIVWTYYGQSILPILHKAISQHWAVSTNHGGMSDKMRDRSKSVFKAGDTQIFLTSDAGARGINLPNASYSIQYDMPVTYSTYVQRMDRNHRIDSMHDVVTNISYMALDTVEEGIAKLVIKRNMWSDKVLDSDLEEGDGGAVHLDAAFRRRLIRVSKKNPVTPEEEAAAA